MLQAVKPFALFTYSIVETLNLILRSICNTCESRVQKALCWRLGQWATPTLGHLAFDTQSLYLKSRPILSFRTQCLHPCHSELSFPFPVILNAAERSEESKLAAHTPFADFRFLASLEITEVTQDNLNMSTQPGREWKCGTWTCAFSLSRIKWSYLEQSQLFIPS